MWCLGQVLRTYIRTYRFNMHVYVHVYVCSVRGVCVVYSVHIVLCISCVTGRYSDEYEEDDLLGAGASACAIY